MLVGFDSTTSCALVCKRSGSGGPRPTRTPDGSPPTSEPRVPPSCPDPWGSHTPQRPAPPSSPSNECSSYLPQTPTIPRGRPPPSARCGWRSRPPSASDRSSAGAIRSEEHTSALQSPDHLSCRLLLE